MISIPKGEIYYQAIHNGININGILYSEQDLNDAVQSVANVCFDLEGEKEFEDYVSSIDQTGFRKLTIRPNVKDWQVGEGLATAYLSAHFACFFPWTSIRDLKNVKASVAGADLVGFYQEKFVFGEVKTSKENNYPPQVTTKKGDGLNDQLSKLCMDVDTTKALVQYLFFHTEEKDRHLFGQACRAYLKDKNFYVFGFLIRDVHPNIKDWSHITQNFIPHKKDKVFLLAIYLPNNGGIHNLHIKVLDKRGVL